MAEEKDDRPLVKDLLEQHASNLTELRVILEKEDNYSQEHYDDIWMLRFLLTHKKISKASAAAIKTMKFRQEKGLNELGDVRNKLYDHFDIVKKYLTFCKANTAFIYAQPDPDRGLVQIISPGQVDMGRLVENMSHEELLDTYILTNEIIYQILDGITRRTGKLTKLLKILDASDFALSSFNVEYVKRDAAANKLIQDFYPQLLGTVVVANPGSWFTAAWRLFKPLFPKRFVEKMAIVQPLNNSKDVKYFLKYVSKDNLWERYGGKNSDWPIAQ